MLLTFGGDDAVVAHRLTMRAVRERAVRADVGFLLAVKACMLLGAAAAAQDEPRLNRDQVRLFAQHVVTLNEHITTGPGYRRADATQTGALAVRVLHLRVWALALPNLAGDPVAQAVVIAEPLLADTRTTAAPNRHGPTCGPAHAPAATARPAAQPTPPPPWPDRHSRQPHPYRHVSFVSVLTIHQPPISSDHFLARIVRILWSKLIERCAHGVS
jgi:hypothetical protein